MSAFDPVEVISKKSVDFQLMRDGTCILYHKKSYIENDKNWLLDKGYEICEFYCGEWKDRNTLHIDLQKKLKFPYYGMNLDALNDSLSHRQTPKGYLGSILIFYQFDSYLFQDQEYALNLLDVLDYCSRQLILFGERLLILLQVDNSALEIYPISFNSVIWNFDERFTKNRGISKDKIKVIGKKT